MIHKSFPLICNRCGCSSLSKEDYEIFSLNDKLQQDLGHDITFING